MHQSAVHLISLWSVRPLKARILSTMRHYNMRFRCDPWQETYLSDLHKWYSLQSQWDSWCHDTNLSIWVHDHVWPQSSNWLMLCNVRSIVEYSSMCGIVWFSRKTFKDFSEDRVSSLHWSVAPTLQCTKTHVQKWNVTEKYFKNITELAWTCSSCKSWTGLEQAACALLRTPLSRLKTENWDTCTYKR